MYNFESFCMLLYAFLPARVAASYYNLFVLPVGLCEWKITTAQPILTIMFKNVLRTLEAEILRITKNIQPQASSTLCWINLKTQL